MPYETWMREPPPVSDLAIEQARRIADLEEFIRREVRKAEMQAAIMRNLERTGGWAGAESVAMAFERAAERHREILNK
jgi:hypothetical protein